MRPVVTVLGTLVLVGAVSGVASAQATAATVAKPADKQEIRNDKKELKDDRKEVRSDRRDAKKDALEEKRLQDRIKADKTRGDVKAAAHDQAALDKLHKDMRADKKDLKDDKKDAKNDRKDLKNDVKDAKRDGRGGRGGR